MDFIKLNRSNDSFELLKDPASFMLLTLISIRAKRTDSFNVNNLKKGQALIGDFRNIGLTEATYRRAKNTLTKNGLISIQTTNKGTIATLLNTSVFDININNTNGQTTDKPTENQRTDNGQTTTNKKEKKDNNIPTLNEFFDYCKTIVEINFNQYEFSLKSKYETWIADKWKDGHGSPIKNWKTKIKNTIPHLKPNYNIQTKVPIKNIVYDGAGEDLFLDIKRTPDEIIEIEKIGYQNFLKKYPNKEGNRR